MPQVKQHVSLLRYTPIPEEIIAMGAKLCYSDATIEQIENGVGEKDQSRYIKMLVKLGHHSVLEHASFTFGIEGVSRALLAQITRHRIASFSVKSQRYVGATHDEGTFNYIIPPQIEALGEDAIKEFNAQMATVQGWYNGWVDKFGKAGENSYEDARFVLPNAAETKIIFTMNARELLHFFHKRCCNRAQWEIRDVAWQMLGMVKEVAPALFSDAGPSCVEGKCIEGKKTCGQIEEVRKRAKNIGVNK